MNPIIIPTNLPAALVVVSDEALDRIADLTTRAGEIPAITSPQEFTAADALLADAVALLKAIEVERQKLKRPVIDLGRALDEAASEATAGLVAIKTKLGKRLLAFQQEENARREEERRRLAEQERQAAAAAAAAHAAAEAQRREAEKAAALAMAQEAEDTPPWEQPAAPAPVVAPEPVHVPTVLPPTYEQQVAAAPLKSGSVVQKTAKKVEVVSPSLVPDEIAGVKLWILDLKTIDRLAKSGVVIPGVVVSEITTIAAKG